MHNAIKTRIDHERGCGWRKVGGLYLVSDELAAPCQKLPVPCNICPTCGHGIKFARDWTWINGDNLKAEATKSCSNMYCDVCPLGDRIELGRVGLLWIGERYYKTPADFTQETITHGVSRRIAVIPRKFKIGETWVFLAHCKAIMDICECANDSAANSDCPICNGEKIVYTKGIFHVFKPKRIECIVSGDEPDEYIERLVEREITPVRVQKYGEQIDLVQ